LPTQRGALSFAFVAKGGNWRCPCDALVKPLVLSHNHEPVTLAGLFENGEAAVAAAEVPSVSIPHVIEGTPVPDRRRIKNEGVGHQFSAGCPEKRRAAERGPMLAFS